MHLKLHPRWQWDQLQKLSGPRPLFQRNFLPCAYIKRWNQGMIRYLEEEEEKKDSIRWCPIPWLCGVNWFWVLDRWQKDRNQDSLPSWSCGIGCQNVACTGVLWNWGNALCWSVPQYPMSLEDEDSFSISKHLEFSQLNLFLGHKWEQSHCISFFFSSFLHKEGEDDGSEPNTSLCL